MPRGLPRHHAHPWPLPLIWISVLLLVPTHASPHCIDSQTKRVVKKEKCSAGCCVYGRQTAAQRLPECGSQQECDAHGNRTHYRSSGSRNERQQDSSLIISLCMCIILVTLLALFGGQYYYYHQGTLKAQQAQKILNAEFPPTVYGKVDDPECSAWPCESECCICLQSLKDDAVRKLHCNHVFHKECFDKWCSHQSKLEESQCPLCKRQVMQTIEKGDPTMVPDVEQGLAQQASDRSALPTLLMISSH